MAATFQPGSAEAADPNCRGKRATIVGTDGPDRISATRESDVIFTGAGDDVVSRIGYNDRVCSGRGDDVLSGKGGRVFAGKGADRTSSGVGTYRGGRGPDLIKVGYGSAYGGRGNDRVESEGAAYGGPGRDRLLGGYVVVGGPGDDLLEAMPHCGPRMDPGSGDDIVRGDSGGCLDDDFGTASLDMRGAPRGVRVDLRNGIAVGWGRDRLSGIRNVNGSLHDDVLIGDHRRNRLDGLGGDDRLAGRSGKDGLDGDDAYNPGEGGGGVSGSDVLEGGRGADHLSGREGNDRLDGGAGLDHLLGGEGPDLLDGGSGDGDVASFESDIGGGDHGVEVDLQIGIASGRGNDKLAGFETVEGSSYDDLLLGDDDANIFISGYGDDIVNGAGGDDVIIDPHPQAWPPAGNDTYDGGAGVDTVSWATADEPMTVDLATGTAAGNGSDTLSGIEIIIGSRNPDRLLGDDADNKLFGGEGDDHLDGRGGLDSIDGGSGVDVCLNGEELKDCP